MTARVFRRSASPNPPVAVEAHGSTIVDADGKTYLDAAGGAIVVNVGHGRREIADAMAEQAGRLAYAHGSRVHDGAAGARTRRASAGTCRSTTRRSTRCRAARRRSRRRSSWPGPTSSRAARRTAGSSIARWGSYHGNTLGALDLSGRSPAPPPYEALARPVPARQRGVSVPRRRTRARRRWATARRAGGGARRRRSRRPGPGPSRAFVGGADRRGDAGRGRAARRLLAGASPTSAAATACCSSRTRS